MTMQLDKALIGHDQGGEGENRYDVAHARTPSLVESQKQPDAEKKQLNDKCRQLIKYVERACGNLLPEAGLKRVFKTGAMLVRKEFLRLHELDFFRRSSGARHQARNSGSCRRTRLKTKSRNLLDINKSIRLPIQDCGIKTAMTTNARRAQIA
jgi:hypothetical protein